MNNLDFAVLKPLLKDFIAYYYDMPEKGAGGYLHVVLDDGNFGYSMISSCQNDCEENGDTFGMFLCDLLLQFTDEELDGMYEQDFWGMRKSKN